MNRWILLAILIVLVFLTLALQEFIPPLAVFWGARILLVPVFFCFGALELPLLLMLILAVFTGLVSDLMILQVIGDRVEIALGWSIVAYVLMGSVLQGLRTIYLRGRWEIHAFGSAFCTIAILGGQFLMITARRIDEGGLVFDWIVLWRILVPGSVALLVSPLIYFGARSLGMCLEPRRGRAAYR